MTAIPTHRRLQKLRERGEPDPDMSEVQDPTLLELLRHADPLVDRRSLSEILTLPTILARSPRIQ
jgi:hypothetical protein